MHESSLPKPTLAVIAAFLLAISTWPGAANAHAPSTSYLTLNVGEYDIAARLELNLLDLSQVLGLDEDGNGDVTWGEVRTSEEAIFEQLRASIRFSSEGESCLLQPQPVMIERKIEGVFVVIDANLDCPIGPLEKLRLDYDYLFDFNADHRAFVNLSHAEVRESRVLKSDERFFEITVGEEALFGTLVVFIREGIFHIIEGIDHVLFLIALLLPAVYRREQDELVPVTSLKVTLWTTFKVITSFTIAHSLTLALVSFKAMPFPPTRYVESLVALTILLTALNNVVPVFIDRRWVVGFGFGLIHGIGYSSILEDLGLTQGEMIVALFGFNVGVEVAQLTIVLAVLPFMFVLRKKPLYYKLVYQLGSAATALLALCWMVDRLFELRMMPF